MADAYTPLTPGAAPSLGTQGDAVKTFQTQLNTQNAGQAGYTPLVVDGRYGPLTQSAAAYKAPPAAPTIGSIYQQPTPDDPELAKAQAAADTYAKNEAAGTPNVDEGAIRANTLSQFQGEIDAQNEIYAQKLREAIATGAGRIGSSTAVQARRGLLGSDFGNAETDTIKTGNDQIYAGIGAEKASAISSIIDKSNTAATEAIAAKNKAIGDGLDAHLKFLQDAGVRKTTNATKAAQAIYDQKLTPDQLTPDQLNQTAKGFGITADDIKSAYVEVKKTSDAAATKTALENAKDKNQALPASAQEYEYAKSQGYKGSYTQYQNDDANRKALANNKATVSEQLQSTFNKVGQLFSNGYTIPNSGGKPFLDPNGYATPAGFDAALKASGVSRTDFIKQFGYLVAPGLESNYKISGAEAKLITGASPLPVILQ